MPRETKTERERRQVEGFLRGLLAYDTLESMENNDPPDVRVWQGGRVILNLEVTEYHVDPTEVAANSRWNVRLLPKIDELKKQGPSLKDIYAFVAFVGGEVPRLSNAENDGLATELVRLASQIASTLADLESLKISFLTRSICMSHPLISPGWHRFPSEDWPFSAQHIAAVTFERFSQGWHRWMCPQADMGWTRQTSDKFLAIFDEKGTKVRRALHDTARFIPGVPTWLIIVSDMSNDMTSHLFPTNTEDRAELFQLIDECNYDFANSPFAEVWLYADFGQPKLRLFPRT